MKKIINNLLITTALAIFANAAYGAAVSNDGYNVKSSNLEMRISAYADFQAGAPKQNRLERDEKKVSANRKDFAFYNSAAAFLDLSKDNDDITYGGKIVLVPSAKKKGSPSFNGTHVFLQSEYGKVEVGSPISAGTKMFVDAGDITAAVDNWERYTVFNSKSLSHKGLSPSFASFDEFFLDSVLVTNLENRKFSSEPSRGINYFTPKYTVTPATKIQVGVSYIPDSSNTGADGINKNSSGEDIRYIESDKSEFFKINRNVKDAITAGLTVEQNISDGVDVKVGITGEYGKSAGHAKRIEKDKLGKESCKVAYKLKDLRGYNIGAIVTLGNFSLAGSYGSLGKSLTSPEFHKTGRQTNYYTGAVAYNQGPFTASISYFRSEQFKNTVDAISLGTDYVLAPGFKPYAVISQFDLKGRPEFFPEVDKRKARGTVAIVGTKLSL